MLVNLKSVGKACFAKLTRVFVRFGLYGVALGVSSRSGSGSGSGVRVESWVVLGTRWPAHRLLAKHDPKAEGLHDPEAHTSAKSQ